MIYQIVRLFILVAVAHVPTMDGRNLRRKIDPSIPTITVSSTNPSLERTWASRKSNYVGHSKKYTLRNSFLRLKPIKHGFDQAIFDQYRLPDHSMISFRDKTGIVSSQILSDLASELIEEIKVGQRHFTHFKVLKDEDFNYGTLSGLLILKYRNYPFVLKISIEHPYTLIEPFSKNIKETGKFVTGGNLRHLSNFTRITNLHKIKQILSYNPFYLECLDFPRKWYWAPKNSYQLKVEWKCLDQKDTIYLPGIYATISDFIVAETYQPQNELNKLSMKVTTDVGFHIDPHSGNIVIEEGTRKYVLLDTEDFRLMTGLNANMNATKYIGWYIELTTNALEALYYRSKKDRIEQSTRL